ncbi:MAG: hypothetical protein HZB26_12350 [Candidatus Hydrogenedentes bacterium]|nr:hypothetical protein [Candidatus Hydrogenedentota bacterium]
MEKTSNIGFAVVLLIAVAITTFQGSRLEKMREAERFYRWIITYANQARTGSEEKKTDADSEGPKAMDAELFKSVVEITDRVLDNVDRPLVKDDYDSNGKVWPKIVLTVKDAVNESNPDVVKERFLYQLAGSNDLAPQRKEFLTYLREKKIAAFGDPLNPSKFLDPNSGDVNLGVVFFGFRTMAANLVWLQVDKFWHQGEMHRMYPLMKTCVALDPNFIDAFLLGAWHLSFNMTAGLPDTPEKLKVFDPIHKMRIGDKERLYNYAIDFLKDGIRKNPKNYKLYFDLGFAVYETKMGDHYNAQTYLSEAIRHRHDQWVPRMLYRALQLAGHYEDALAGWEDYKAKFPDSSKDVVSRSMSTIQGLIKERDAEIEFYLADQEKALADQARKTLAEAKAASDAARAANNEAEAQKQDSAAAAATQKIEQAEAKEKEARAKGDALYAEARAIWEQMSAGESGDPFAFGRIARMDARKMIANQQYREAIGLLDYARYQSNAFWSEGSDMIIEAKQKGGIALNLSERMELARREDAKQYANEAPKQIGGRFYEYRADAWYQDDYRGQVTKPYLPTPEEFAKSKREIPELQQILNLGAVTFQIDDVWYQYTPPQAQPAAIPAAETPGHARIELPVRFTTPRAA